jgi:sulfatase modifying factor 1
MRRFALLLIVIATSIVLAGSASGITIPVVPIGNIGNAYGPPTGSGGAAYGGVNYAYSIGTTEVTIAQYASFLNSVASTDTYELYHPSMATDLKVAGIARNGSPGSYSYSVLGSPNKPITYVNWADAARFCNWLHNGQPTGLQTASTTEDGAYPVNGAMSYLQMDAIARQSNAQWFLPTVDEWHKAAYHKNDGVTGNYWVYPTRSNTAPFSDQPPGLDAPLASNTANFYGNDGLANSYNDGYAVTGTTSFSSGQSYLTDVGAYTAAASPYGTYDQAGNVMEWTEGLMAGSQRVAPGSSWVTLSGVMQSHIKVVQFTTNQSPDIGFRVATKPYEAIVQPSGNLVVHNLGGGPLNIGGISIGVNAATGGTLQQTYSASNLNQLPPIPAFDPHNLTFEAPGESLQFWDLHFTGSLAEPAHVTFYFDQSLVATGLPIGIWHFDNQVGWEYLGGTIQGNSITVTVNGFSPFALGAAPGSTGPQLEGDYNNDNIVNGADYVLWRKNGGTQTQFDIWRSHFGNAAGSGSSIESASVPEPSTLLLLGITAISLLGYRKAKS